MNKRFFIWPCIFHSCGHQSNPAVSIIQQMESHFFHHFWSRRRNAGESTFEVLIKPSVEENERRNLTWRFHLRACFHKTHWPVIPALHYVRQCMLNSDECRPEGFGEYICEIGFILRTTGLWTNRLSLAVTDENVTEIIVAFGGVVRFPVNKIIFHFNNSKERERVQRGEREPWPIFALLIKWVVLSDAFNTDSFTNQT